MKAATTALGIDIGSTNTKVAVIRVDASVTELSVQSSPTPRDASSLIDTVLRLISAALAATGARPEVVGIASMAETGVPLDAAGDPLTALLRWDGTTGSRAADHLFDRLGRRELFAATGVPASAKAPLAIWAGIRQEQPQLWSAMAHWAGMCDLIGWALTGELGTDHTLAGRTMAYRLPAASASLSREFDDALLAEAGMPVARLPRILLPGEILGFVTPTAATSSGLVAGTPVIIAGHDHAVGSWAAGVRSPGDAADSVGTAEALVRVLGAPVDRAEVAGCGMSLTRSVTGTHECLLAASSSAGSFLRWWFRTHLGGAEPTRLLAAGDYLDPDPTGLLVLPYLRGRQTPVPDPDATVQLLDVHGAAVAPGTRPQAELVRAAFEGLSLQLRWMDDEQRRLAGHPEPGAIVVLGGNVDRHWTRIKAAVLPGAVSSVAAREPVAAGAALLALARLHPRAQFPTLPAVPEPHHGTDRYRAVFDAFVVTAARTPTPVIGEK